MSEFPISFEQFRSLSCRLSRLLELSLFALINLLRLEDFICFRLVLLSGSTVHGLAESDLEWKVPYPHVLEGNCSLRVLPSLSTKKVKVSDNTIV
jgi:hypothetical protein